MIRIVLALSAVVLVSACMEPADAPVSRVTAGAFPVPFVMVGESGPGMIAAGEFKRDGIIVKTAFSGRAAGIVTFCSGKADAVLMSDGFTRDEWQICMDLNGTWSAFSTLKGAVIYVNPHYATELLKKGKTSFLG